MSSRYHVPAVAYAFFRPRWAGLALSLLGLVLLASSLAWCRQAQSDLLSILLSILVVLSAFPLLYGVWRDWPQGRILWSGEDWSLELQSSGAAQTSQSVQLGVGLDGGSWLWLRVSSVLGLKPGCGRQRVLWIFIAQQHTPEQWGDLRRAVYSSIVLRTEQG